MRRLVWFTIGFCFACIFGIYFLYADALLLVAAACGGVITICLVLPKKLLHQVVACVATGCMIGAFWLWCYDAYYLSFARACDTQTRSVQVVITQYAQETQIGSSTTGEIKINGKKFTAKLYLDNADILEPGDVVEGNFMLAFCGAGGSKSAASYAAKGIFLIAYQKGEISITQDAENIGFVQKLQMSIKQTIDKVFPDDTRAFARALLLGDSSLLPYETDTAFKVSGIRHVIAVSGLHVSILFSLVYMLMGKRRVLTALVGIPVLVIFAAIAGFTPSINRACIMQSLMILAMLFNRQYDPPTSLAFAVLVMLFVNPMTLTSVGFQLSVGCILGIFLFSRKISNYLHDEKRFGPAKGKSLRAKVTRWIIASISVTISAMIVTTPLCAVYFRMVSIAGIVTNILTLWIISFIFYGIIAACLASFVFAPLASIIAWLVSIAIRFVIWVAKCISSFPYAAVYTCSTYVVIWLVVAYILLSVFLLQKKKHPVALCSCIAATLCLALLLSWVEPRIGSYRMSVMDVGQGQCVLLQSKGKNYLVDCGGDNVAATADIAAEQLLSQGVFRLDGLVLTHYDIDHAASAMLLLSRIDVETIYLPDVEPKNTIRNKIVAAYPEKVCFVRENLDVAFSGSSITIIPAQAGIEDNDCSLCVLFQTGKCDILITGDRSTKGEHSLLASCELPDIEILVAGHHGSKTSTSLELLTATKPELAIISVGNGNRYNLPADEVVRRLQTFGCRILRTDTEGTITLWG